MGTRGKVRTVTDFRPPQTPSSPDRTVVVGPTHVWNGLTRVDVETRITSSVVLVPLRSLTLVHEVLDTPIVPEGPRDSLVPTGPGLNTTHRRRHGSSYPEDGVDQSSPVPKCKRTGDGRDVSYVTVGVQGKTLTTEVSSVRSVTVVWGVTSTCGLTVILSLLLTRIDEGRLSRVTKPLPPSV